MDRTGCKETSGSEKSSQVGWTSDHTFPAGGAKGRCGPFMDPKTLDLMCAEDILDTCDRELEELKLKIQRTTVRCSILEVDLATQFNPYYTDALKNAQEACRRCTTVIQSEKATERCANKQRDFSSKITKFLEPPPLSCSRVVDGHCTNTTDEQMMSIDIASALHGVG